MQLHTLRLSEPSGQPSWPDNSDTTATGSDLLGQDQPPARGCGSAPETDLLYRKPNSRLYSTHSFSGPVKPKQTATKRITAGSDGTGSELRATSVSKRAARLQGVRFES